LYPKNAESEIFVAKVYGYHSAFTNDLLGEVEIFVPFILDPSKHRDWYPLMNKVGPTTFRAAHGEIMLNFCLFENGILKASHPPFQQIGVSNFMPTTPLLNPGQVFYPPPYSNQQSLPPYSNQQPYFVQQTNNQQSYPQTYLDPPQPISPYQYSVPLYPTPNQYGSIQSSDNSQL